MQFLTGRKWIFTRSLGTWILRFNLEMKLTKHRKNYPEIHGQTKGGGRTIAPPLNTPLLLDPKGGQYITTINQCSTAKRL